MEARVQGCVTCHGQSGQGTSNEYFPRIAGKPAGYLYNQLVDFRDGTRHYPPMNYLVAYLPDAYLRFVVSRGVGELGVDPTTCAAPRIVCIAATIRLFTPEKLAKRIREWLGR